MRPINKKMSFSKDVVRIEPYSLPYVSDHYKSEEICNDAVEDLYKPGYVPVYYRTAKLC